MDNEGQSGWEPRGEGIQRGGDLTVEGVQVQYAAAFAILIASHEVAGIADDD